MIWPKRFKEANPTERQSDVLVNGCRWRELSPNQFGIQSTSMRPSGCRVDHRNTTLQLRSIPSLHHASGFNVMADLCKRNNQLVKGTKIDFFFSPFFSPSSLIKRASNWHSPGRICSTTAAPLKNGTSSFSSIEEGVSGSRRKSPQLSAPFLAFFSTPVQKKGRIEGRGGQEHLNICGEKVFNVGRGLYRFEMYVDGSLYRTVFVHMRGATSFKRKATDPSLLSCSCARRPVALHL